MDARFIFGLDLAQKHDYTAICIAQITRDEEGPYARVRYLEHFRGRSYTWITSYVKELTNKAPLNRSNTKLIVDAGGVGDAVRDMFRVQRMPHIALKVHAGEKDSFVDNVHRVSKVNFITNLLVLFEKKRFRISTKLPQYQILYQELGNYRIQITDKKNETFEAREGEHDDMVFAAALCAWGAVRFGGVEGPAEELIGKRRGLYTPPKELPFSVEPSLPTPFSL